MSDTQTGRQRLWLSRSAESLVFCLWYLVANGTYGSLVGMLWQPCCGGDIAAGALMWTMFAAFAVPFVFILWYGLASVRPSLDWPTILMIAVLIVFIPTAIVGVLTAGIVLGLWHIILPTLPVAVLVIWLFDLLRRRFARRTKTIQR